ncbi:MAG: hypothetical protein L0312_26685 [Acidobacteria bacterium]|nr:hypothetical protein [Acidobacteriota bacterium]
MQRSFEVEIKGITPLLMHAFPLVPLEALEKKPIAEQAEAAAYRIPSSNGNVGDLYIPGTAIQRGLVGAATFSKGKGRASLQKQAAACLFVTPEYVSLNTKEYAIDSRPVVIPATKGRVLRHRPRLDSWGVKFTLEFDDSLISETQLRQIVDDLGQRVGLLEFRPERKGPFGRFMVTKWLVRSGAV